jgi:hypothetical protein
LRRQRTGLKLDVMLVTDERASVAAVVLAVDQIRDVLQERAAPRDVQHLHASADAE